MACKLIDEQIIGPVHIRYSGELSKGVVIEGHTHNFDHTTFVFSGRVGVVITTPAGVVTKAEYGKASAFEVLAEDIHEITSLEDGTSIACVFPHRDVSGEAIEKYTGNRMAYH